MFRSSLALVPLALAAASAAPPAAHDHVTLPRSLPELLVSPALSSEELGTLAGALRSPEYWNAPTATVEVVGAGRLVVIGTSAIATAGEVRHLGMPVVAGEAISRGLLYNPGPEDAAILIGEAEMPELLPVGGLIAVGDFIAAEDGGVTAAPGSLVCEVECSDPYVACCFFGNGHPVCRCVHEGNTGVLEECHAGGPGAVHCALHQPVQPTDVP